MKKTEDTGWEQMLDTMDFDAAELALAEQRLAQAEHRRLPEAAVERMVAQVTQQPPAVRPVTTWNARRWSKVAALVIAAALVATAPLWPEVVWPTFHKSAWTMTYAEAIESLEREDQPEDGRESALNFVRGSVLQATDALIALRDNSGSGREVADRAAACLREVLEVAGGSTRAREAVIDEDVAELASQALDTTGSLPARLRRIDQLRSTAVTGVLVIRNTTGLGPRRDGERQEFLDKLSLRIRPIPYADALELFADTKAPVPERRQALQVLKRRTLSGIRVLKTLASAPGDLELAASSGRWLINLRSEREVANGAALSDSALGQVEALIKLTTLGMPERLEHLDRLAMSTAAGLGALKHASGLSPELEALRTLHLSELREELVR